jgi:hypothetical protein
MAQVRRNRSTFVIAGWIALLGYSGVVWILIARTVAELAK